MSFFCFNVIPRKYLKPFNIQKNLLMLKYYVTTRLYKGGDYMKLTVLCDNNTFIDNYLLGEPALCFHIDNGKDKILFDMGYSGVYKTNAKKLGIDLNNLTKVVFSHGHDDHTRGLTTFNYKCRPQIYYCKGCFDRKKSSTCEIGAPYRLGKMQERFSMTEVLKPTKISENLYFFRSSS